MQLLIYTPATINVSEYQNSVCDLFKKKTKKKIKTIKPMGFSAILIIAVKKS